MKKMVLARIGALALKIAATVVIIGITPSLPNDQSITLLIGYGLGAIPMVLGDLIEMYDTLH